MLDSDFSPQQDRVIGQATGHRGGRATHTSPLLQAIMGQCNTESSTAGTQPPSWRQHLSRVHFSHPTAQQAGNKGTVGHPETLQCSRVTGTRLSRSETVLLRAPRLVRQRQAGQCFLPLHACPVGLGTWGQWAQTELSSQGICQPPPPATRLAAGTRLTLSSSRRPSCLWRWPLR